MNGQNQRCTASSFGVPTATLTLFSNDTECWKPDVVGEEEIQRWGRHRKMGKKDKGSCHALVGVHVTQEGSCNRNEWRHLIYLTQNCQSDIIIVMMMMMMMINIFKEML